MKVVILDRDGVINADSAEFVKTADEFQPMPGSIEAIAKLHKNGFKICVVTNQSGLGRNLFDKDALTQIHHKLCSMVEEMGGVIEGIFFCPHLPEDNCTCRKPKTGLLEQIESEFDCSIAGSYFVGDSLKDIQAAKAFGCFPILVSTGNGVVTQSLLEENGCDDVLLAVDLAAAVDYIIEVTDV
jgi:D-glycero-D-manno-heptose 1,7-bisphosphate phosphatase|tara:strand:- start:59 stop:610 length:552 start_codon:yes stop_codon:yes gene_type:complete